MDIEIPFGYPDLRCYRKDVVEKAEASETFNRVRLPGDVYPKYARIFSGIMDSYMRPVFSKGDKDAPCLSPQTNKHEEIDFNTSHFPPARDTCGHKYAKIEPIIHLGKYIILPLLVS